MIATASPQRPVAVSPPRDRAPVIESFDPDAFVAPTGREEEWRYTPIRRIKEFFEPFGTVDGADVAIHSADPTMIGFDAAEGPIRPGDWLVPSDRPSALAWQHAPAWNGVTVPHGTKLDEPITVTITGRSSSYQAVRVTVEHDASATVVIDHCGSGRHVGNIEVELQPRAQLTLVSVQEWDRRASQLLRLHSHVGADAQLTQVLATFGGDVVRVVSTVDFGGPGASVDMLGAYFTAAGQHHEHRLLVDHAQPRCRSRVLYKGALSGTGAHGVWVGDVLIRAGAVGTDTYETSRSLVMSPGARADSVPNLEIETGDVARAGHASTTGRFDDEQLFYLRSRGIDEHTARRLVARGFLGEVLARVPVDEVRDRLAANVERQLAAGGD